MHNIVGFLLRRGRLEKNLSQEGLCKGICAASYLSKIEKGLVEPGRDIVERLFAALSIPFEQDAAFLQTCKQALYTFFDRFFHEEPTEESAGQLEAAADRLENSILYIPFSLYRVYTAGDAEKALARLRSLAPFERYMNEDEGFYYWLAFACVPGTETEAAAGLVRANALRPCSLARLQYAYFLTNAGKMQEALTHVEEGIRYAVEEGDVYMLRQLCMLEGTCYANLLQYDLMLRAYDRAKNLYRGEPFMLATISYNIGATLLEMRRYEEALPHLLASTASLDIDPLWPNHKLAIVYGELDRHAEGRPYLEKAVALAEKMPLIFQQTVAVVSLRYNKGYLDDDTYLETLRAVYDRIMDYTAYGFKQFHGYYLVEAYAHRRKYKEALSIAKEIHWPLS